MIEKLTDAQIAKFPEYVKKWTEIGLSTEPANRPEAERGIREMYQCAGLNPPTNIVWCGSPLSQGLTRANLLNNSVGASVWDSVGASVRASVGDSVWASVRASVRNSVRDSVWASVGDSVWASVGDSVWASVRNSVYASVRNSVRDSVRDSGYGSHDASWLSFADFFYRECGLKKETEKLSGLWRQATSAGWYLPYEQICWVSERHNVLNRDDQGRIHSTTGPAIAYPDGWSIYAVHGVRVPEKVITEKARTTPEMIEQEKNQEVRRVMLDLYGMDRYFKKSGAKKIHSDRFGELYQKTYPDGDLVKFVRVINSTPEPDGSRKPYFLFTSQEVKTAHEAVAASFGMTPEQYQPREET